MVYKIEPLDLNALLLPVTAATAAVTRLDERLARSPVRDGFIERQHFADACAALWLEGELVHAEDLVLHDAHMDIRTPTHELTRAHGVLRARRQIAANKPIWALSRAGLARLTGRGGVADGHRANTVAGDNNEDDNETVTALNADAQSQASQTPAPDELTKALEAMDAALQRSAKVLDGQDAQTGLGTQAALSTPQTPERPALVYDLDWDENARLAEWQEVIASTRALPAVLRVALLIDAWGEIDVLQHAFWLGPLLTAALLREQGLAGHHLYAVHLGLKQIPRESRRAPDRLRRLIAQIEAFNAGAMFGLKEHDRLIQARQHMQRKLTGKRKNSKLSALIDLTLTRPLITAPLVQKELKLSQQGALNLIGELALREVTGRGRYRAWAVG